MKHAVGVSALVLGACLVAGCGGVHVTGIGDPVAPTSIQALAHRQAAYYGDPHAAIAGVETVRIAGARPGHVRWAMIRMKSRHSFRVGCPSVGPGPPGECNAHYLEVGVDLAHHRVGLDWGLTTSQVSAIARARRASPRFRIFPDTTGLYVRCAIPRGGPPGGTLRGTCSTVAPPSARVRHVEFVESWGGSHEASWVVQFGRGGRIDSIRVRGEPPQLWK